MIFVRIIIYKVPKTMPAHNKHYKSISYFLLDLIKSFSALLFRVVFAVGI